MSTANTSVSSGVSALLPDVLIEYLWKLALSGENWKCLDQTFLLNHCEMGGRHAQEICRLYETQRIFGVEPVHCKLHVLSSKNSRKMILAHEL